MSSVTQAKTGAADGRRVLELQRCSLLVRTEPRKGEQLIIEGDLFRIGKSPDNDLVLTDTTVSRDHCEIVRENKGYLLRDLGSTNGTLLDGSEIREGYLRAGSIITVGRVELEVRPYAERIDVAPSTADRFGDLVGRDPGLREIYGLLERLAPSDVNLLIGGETGTGKDLLARSVHKASKRRDGPFIVVDCGAVVGSLIESELFGHEKGAFTGAIDRRQGAFELAQRGTLFLDEIGELPLELQPKLLRALESRRIRRVGGAKEIPLDIRVIAASNRNLQLEVERGKFRQDLYFRLAVVPIELPPLRERRGDIPLLAHHLLEQICEQLDASEPPLSMGPAAVEALTAHDWPGNVRELRNVLERAALMTRAAGETSLILAGVPMGTPARASQVSAPQASQEFDPSLKYREVRALWEADFERRYVGWLLARHDGNLSAAAREAGMDRKYLHKLARKHGLRE